jgi:hypothetical protein
VWPMKEKNGRGEEKEARQRWGTLLSGCGGVGVGVGDGLREAPRGGEEWGGAWGPTRWSGGTVWPAAALTGGVRSAPKQGRRGTARWGPGTVTDDGI